MTFLILFSCVKEGICHSSGVEGNEPSEKPKTKIEKMKTLPEFAKSNPVTPAITKSAHALRKSLSEKHGVPIRFIQYRDCLAVALGRMAESKIRNHFGWTLQSKVSLALDTYLLSGDCPVAFCLHDLKELMRGKVNPAQVEKHTHALTKMGAIRNNKGYLSVTEKFRPFAHPFAG